MGDSKTTLYNQALGQIGITRRIALPTEASVEAETCELYYDLLRRSVLSAAHWPSCRGTFRLNKLAEKLDGTAWTNGDPQAGWLYAYALPADYIRARYLNGMDFFELSAYTAADFNQQNGIVTNVPQAVLTYTRDNTNIESWEVPLRNAMVYALAATVSYALTRKNNKSITLIEQANGLIKTARQETANAEDYQQERVAPWIHARGSVYNVIQRQQFIYPEGALLSFQGVINSEAA